MSPKLPPPARGPLGRFSAHFTAKYSWVQFLSIFIVVCGLSAIALSDFSIAVDNEGWISRGTLIAKRSTQYWILNENVVELGEEADNEDLWQKLLTEEQPNFSDDPTLVEEDVEADAEAVEGKARKLLNLPEHRQFQQQPNAPLRRLADNPTDMVCEADLFAKGVSVLDETYHITPLWKTTTGQSIFEPSVVEAICEAEINTMQVLYGNDLCIKDCVDDTKCLAPYSVVYFARAQVEDYTSNLTCSELSAAWSNVRESVETELVACVQDIKDTYTADSTFIYPDSCPAGFYPPLLQETYDTTKSSDVTMSIFPTKWDGTDTVEVWFELLEEMDHGNAAIIQGAYDNERESLNVFYTDSAVESDMILAAASGAITTVAIMLHTRSPWITLIGLLQIVLSFPLSYFFYTFVFGLSFFPFLNFIGIFVVFALGADDVFVAMDKWKNARLDYPTATTSQIASVALPDAAGAMLLTTTTTAVAFFATAICPVAPLKCFAIFVGLLIVFDYLLCCLLVFPALCIYDKGNLKAAQNEKINYCCSLMCKKPQVPEAIAAEKEVPPADSAHAAHVTMDDEENKSLIRRILLGYYNIFHQLRWIILILSLGGTVVAGIYAARLDLPEDSTVRLLGEDVEYEQAWLWRKDMLVTTLDRSSGSPQALCWGAEPADNGNYVDPRSGSTLVLDASFDPSQSQEFLLNFCDGFFEQDFASKLYPEFNCPMNDFNDWLVAEAGSEAPDANYVDFCNDATGLPMPEEDFHACASAWSIMTESSQMVQRNGKIVVMFFYFVGTVRFDSPFNDLRDEWNAIDTYLTEESKPYPSVSNVYAASIDFWWFDTNGSMLRSAYWSAAIALAFSGLVVLISSRSFVLTIFALITISYVLASATAMLVAFGWSLGFLESICFAILIGISCDFVLHFCHAYAHLPGSVSRETRTKYALIRMGPSILAAAFTTIASAAIMLFTVVSFFQQFATILFFTIIQATVGSFVVFTAFADCIGPSHPTALFDKYVPCCKSNATADSSITTPESSEGGESSPQPSKSVTTGAPPRAQSYTNNTGVLAPLDLDEDEAECSC